MTIVVITQEFLDDHVLLSVRCPELKVGSKWVITKTEDFMTWSGPGVTEITSIDGMTKIHVNDTHRGLSATLWALFMVGDL